MIDFGHMRGLPRGRALYRPWLGCHCRTVPGGLNEVKPSSGLAQCDPMAHEGKVRQTCLAVPGHSSQQSDGARDEKENDGNAEGVPPQLPCECEALACLTRREAVEVEGECAADSGGGNDLTHTNADVAGVTQSEDEQRIQLLLLALLMVCEQYQEPHPPLRKGSGRRSLP